MGYPSYLSKKGDIKLGLGLVAFTFLGGVLLLFNDLTSEYTTNYHVLAQVDIRWAVMIIR